MCSVVIVLAKFHRTTPQTLLVILINKIINEYTSEHTLKSTNKNLPHVYCLIKNSKSGLLYFPITKIFRNVMKISIQ